MAETVQALSKIRQMLDATEQFILQVRGMAQNDGAGRELALVLTKVEEARMWAGKGLKHFDTGFQNSDMAGKPETFSKEKGEVLDAVVVEEKEETKEETVQVQQD